MLGTPVSRLRLSEGDGPGVRIEVDGVDVSGQVSDIVLRLYPDGERRLELRLPDVIIEEEAVLDAVAVSYRATLAHDGSLRYGRGPDIPSALRALARDVGKR
jgi:hypothetical protein